MDKYSINLPNDRAKTYGYVTLFVLLTNFFVFVVNQLNSSNFRLSYWGTAICAFSILLFLINHFTRKRYPFRFELVFYILAILWFIAERYLPGLCLIGFGLIGISSNKKFEVIFSKNGITYPSFPQKTFLWADVSNVILKDGMLTIDLKNNRLIQAVIEKESAFDISEEEFNLFCSQQLNVKLTI